MRESAPFCAILLIINVGFGLEYNKQQRYNPNVDFLLHEGGINAPKKDNTVTQSPLNTSPSNSQNNPNSGRRDYVNQFPELRPSSPTSPTRTTSNNINKIPELRPNNPTSPTQAPSNNNLNPNPGYSNTQQNNGKRDYVAPQFPTTKLPQNQQSTGKVKDLINLFDKQPQVPNTPQGVPSYSSILRGSSTNSLPSSAISTSTLKYTQSFTQTTSKPSTKPFSYSSIVAGSNKHNTPSQPTAATLKPNAPYQPTIVTPKPTTRVPVLPSTILNNNNRNNNQGNLNPTDEELIIVSEQLLRKDTNNAAKYITVNYQEKTTSQSKEDKAPLALFTIPPEVWNISTVQKFIPLLDNYERDTLTNEYVTPQERNEENAFMDAIMSTSVIRHLMNFLKEKGYVTPDPKQQRDFLKQLWFSLYSRGKGKISSSGFEHIFVSELKNGEVSGLHNWIYFAREEAANRINYLGYLKYQQLSDKGVVMKLHFNQQGVDKPVDTMFIGTSPELEMALYTLCFVTRADNDCKLKLANEDVQIITHTFRYRSKNLIGSAYPQI